MAYRETIQNSDLKVFMGEANYFYNVGSAVGYGCTNKPDDVRLVQFFLNAQAIFFGERTITVDGKFGGETWRRIKDFQLSDGFNGYGAVSSADGRKFRSLKHGNVYTIYYLNFYYFHYYSEFWNNPKLDPKFPHELKSHLYGPLPNQV